MPKSNGHLGERPIVVGVLNGLRRAVHVKTNRRKILRDIAQRNVVLDAASAAGVVFVTGLAHESAGEMVFAERLINFLRVLGPINRIVEGTGKKRRGLSAGHDKRVV